MSDDFIAGIIGQFRIYGDLLSFREFGGGHINGTFLSEFNQAGTTVRYTHQRINRNVFKRPDEVMENISAVTEHIRARLMAEGIADTTNRALTVVRTRDDLPYFLDANGDYWRTYLFIERARSYEVLDNTELAYKVGEAVGLFQYQLSDYKGPRLHDTIPRFHDMRWRYEQFDAALRADPLGRAAEAKAEIEFLLANRERGMILTDALSRGVISEGITHNDTKLNNILFSEADGEAICMIDLDTVMPGTILFDTGDLIRTATITGAEDERDLSTIRFDIGLFKSLVRGYLSRADVFLTACERNLIAESGRNITQIMAVRFLTDYLNGDVYYKTSRTGHNLDRARTQIALILSMDDQWSEATGSIEPIARKHP